MVSKEPNKPDTDSPESSGTSAPWIRKIVAGGETSNEWQRLFERYRESLTLFAQRQLGPALAETCSADDLVQQAWIEVWDTIREFEYRGPGSLRGWLRIKIRRRAVDLARKHDGGRATTTLENVDIESRAPERSSAQQLRARILGALDKLPRTYARVLEARYLDGHRVITIARSLGMKPDTVSQQIRRGLELWKTGLGGDFSELLAE